LRRRWKVLSFDGYGCPPLQPQTTARQQVAIRSWLSGRGGGSPPRARPGCSGLVLSIPDRHWRRRRDRGAARWAATGNASRAIAEERAISNHGLAAPDRCPIMGRAPSRRFHRMVQAVGAICVASPKACWWEGLAVTSPLPWATASLRRRLPDVAELHSDGCRADVSEEGRLNAGHPGHKAAAGPPRPPGPGFEGSSRPAPRTGSVVTWSAAMSTGSPMWFRHQQQRPPGRLELHAGSGYGRYDLRNKARLAVRWHQLTVAIQRRRGAFWIAVIPPPGPAPHCDSAGWAHAVNLEADRAGQNTRAVAGRQQAPRRGNSAAPGRIGWLMGWRTRWA